MGGPGDTVRGPSHQRRRCKGQAETAQRESVILIYPPQNASCKYVNLVCIYAQSLPRLHASANMTCRADTGLFLCVHRFLSA